MREFRSEQLDDLAFGAAVLGTGGGGNPYVGTLLARQAIEEHGPITVVDPEEVPDDALVVPAAMMGAPTIMVEKLPAGDEIVVAFKALEEYLGRPITHTVSAEAGGLNSVTPFTLAAQLGLPVVDADLMGRAFPELQMCLPSLSGVSATPMAMADEKGNSVVISTISNHWTERIARSITIDMGCSAMIALYAMTGAQLKTDDRPAHPSACGGHRTGGARDAQRRTATSWRQCRSGSAASGSSKGRSSTSPAEPTPDSRRPRRSSREPATARVPTLVLDVQNEHLVARLDGKIAASVPDLIIMLDSETGEPITTEEMRYGFRVTVIAAPCDPRWRTPEGLELVGPRYFGYDVDYVPIEERRAAADRRAARNGPR